MSANVSISIADMISLGFSFFALIIAGLSLWQSSKAHSDDELARYYEQKSALIVESRQLITHLEIFKVRLDAQLHDLRNAKAREEPWSDEDLIFIDQNIERLETWIKGINESIEERKSGINLLSAKDQPQRGWELDMIDIRDAVKQGFILIEGAERFMGLFIELREARDI